MTARRKAAPSRELRPRETDRVAVAPVLISDRTAPSLCGLEPRAFRAFILARGIPHVRHGKRLLVRARDLAEAIGRGEEGPVDARVVVDMEPTRSEILARVAGGRR